MGVSNFDIKMNLIQLIATQLEEDCGETLEPYRRLMFASLVESS